MGMGYPYGILGCVCVACRGLGIGSQPIKLTTPPTLGCCIIREHKLLSTCPPTVMVQYAIHTVTVLGSLTQIGEGVLIHAAYLP